MSEISAPGGPQHCVRASWARQEVARRQWWDAESLQRPRLKGHVLVSQGFMVLRLAKYALGGFLSKSL